MNGILQVTARDLGTGRQHNVTVSAGAGLTRTELEQARTEVERQAKLFAGTREKDRAMGPLRGLIQTTRKIYELVQDKLTEHERSRATQALELAELATEGSLEEIEAALAKLETIAETLGQAMLRG